MVSFRLASRASTVSPKAAQDDEVASSSSSQDAGVLEAPPSPLTPEGAADTPVLPAKKYWPTDKEVEAVLQQLSPADKQHCDAAMANRYLRAVGGDAKHAVKRIRDTLAWRSTERPDLMVCDACLRDPKSHYMQVVGHDLAGRPCIYSCLALATNRDVEDNRKHMIANFEQAIRMMPPPQAGQRPVESWIWVMDFHGFSIRDCDPRLAKIFLNVSAAHYPERLGTFFIVSAPTVFNTLWRAISHFIDPVTKQKIHFVDFKKGGRNTKLQGLLRRYFDEDNTAWLLREMEDNRDKRLALSKAYSYPDLSKLASAGTDAPDVARASEARRQLSTCRAHDHLGTPAFLDALGGQPELLLPQFQKLSMQDGPAH